MLPPDRGVKGTTIHPSALNTSTTRGDEPTSSMSRLGIGLSRLPVALS